MQRLEEVAALMRVDVGDKGNPDALARKLKKTIDALVSPLSHHRKMLLDIMHNPAAPLDDEVRQWTLKQVQSSLDQVKDALTQLPEISELDPSFVERQFTNKGHDLMRAEDTINGWNNDLENVGGFPVRRDVRARTIFKAAITQIAYLLRSIKDKTMDAEHANAELEKNAELVRNLLSKKLILKKDDPQEGWYE